MGCSNRRDGDHVSVAGFDVSLAPRHTHRPKGGLDGAATIRALRELDAGVKVVAASGVGQSAGDGRAVAVGVKHFLAKPYTAEALLSTIGRALSE